MNENGFQRRRLELALEFHERALTGDDHVPDVAAVHGGEIVVLGADGDCLGVDGGACDGFTL